MVDLYDGVISAYKSGDDGVFVARARNWIAAADSNPFLENTVARDLFNNAVQAYSRWQKKNINFRYSKIQMVEFVRKIAELDLPNPYIKTAEQKETEPITVQEVTHIFGVVGDEKPAQKRQSKKPATKKPAKARN